MDEAAKKRLIGAVVLVVLMVIFVPMLFDEPPPASDDGVARPGAAERSDESGFQGSSGGEVFIEPTSPDIEDQSLGADEMMPFDTLPSDERAAFEAPEPAPREPASAMEPPGDEESPAPVEPVGEPTASDEPVAAAPPRPEPAPPRQSRPAAAPPSAAPAPGPAAPAGSFVVQVAALSTAERAASLAEELRGAGFSSFTEEALVQGKTYFRVRVGPEPDRAAASRLADAIERATGHQGQVLVQR